jgi:hypothetical protein
MLPEIEEDIIDYQEEAKRVDKSHTIKIILTLIGKR